MLQVKGIYKSFHENEVLKGIDLDIKEGEVYGLIGANGAGKTTLFNIIAQILEQDSGEIHVDGILIKNMNDLSQKIGYVIDTPSMYEFMNAYEYLSFIYSPANKTKIEVLSRSKSILKLVGLEDVGTKQIKTFSRGMKQRMGIAAGLIFEPQLILMDEPSSALDPQGRFEVLKIIENLKKQGKTIILSTHILNDIERICDRVGLLINGKIAIEGTINDVLARYKQNVLKVKCLPENAEIIKKQIKETKLSKTVDVTVEGVEVAFTDNVNKKQILALLLEKDIDFDEILLKRNTLEEIYLIESKGGRSNV